MALSCFVAFAIVYAYRFTIEDKTKRRIQGAFRHYLAPTLVDRLAERADGLRLGGEVRRVTVWFSDIVGYTSIAERLNAEPEKLVEIVNRYFTALSAVVEGHGGYIDKFIGDAVMCVWGAPLEDAEAERHALEAALDTVAALERFNREVVEAEYELPAIGTRIGINSGLAVVGNMGSTTRFNYTVTGDTVNLASRLEGANKSYGSLVMIGEETARGLGRDFVLRRLDRLVVKGRSQPLKVYELVGRAGEVSAARLARIKAFHGAVALYYRRRFEAAGAAFEALAEADEAARLYAERCRHYLVEPPPDDWDRSFTMTTK
jgi:class 3 adenylate cyclase